MVSVTLIQNTWPQSRWLHVRSEYAFTRESSWTHSTHHSLKASRLKSQLLLKMIWKHLPKSWPHTRLWFELWMWNLVPLKVLSRSDITSHAICFICLPSWDGDRLPARFIDIYNIVVWTKTNSSSLEPESRKALKQALRTNQPLQTNMPTNLRIEQIIF